MKDAIAEAVNVSVDRNFILARYEKHVKALQNMVKLNVVRTLTFTDAMT